MDERSLDIKAKELAKTLKQRGIAASDAMAMQMAKDILRTEYQQLARFEKQKYDPEVNPQQRIPKPAVNPNTNIVTPVSVEGVDPSTPISEAVKEQPVKNKELSSTTTSKPLNPANYSSNNTFTNKPTAQSTQADDQLNNQMQKSISSENNNIIKPPVNNDKSIDSELKKAVSESSEKKEDEPAEAKVDLHSMFNFSKRKF